MKDFEIINNGSLTARINGLIKTADTVLWVHWNLVYNATVRTFETADVSFANKVLVMAKAVGRYKITKTVLVKCVPFAFSTELGFHGKRKAGMYETLKGSYETAMRSLILELQEADSKPKTKAAYDFDRALTTFIKNANKNDVDNDAIVKAVLDATSLAVVKAA